MTNPQISAQELYNEIGSDYKKSKLLPFRWIEAFNYMNLVHRFLDDNKDAKLVLDLACGDGFYTRKLKKNYPEITFVGVDISEKMVELANQVDPVPGIHYIRYDCARMNEAEFKNCLAKVTNEMAPSVDLVCCAYFLNYAKSFDELVDYLKSVASVLNTGARFIGINDNPGDEIDWYQKGLLKKAGVEKSLRNKVEQRYEGQEVIYTAYNTDGTQIDIVNYWISPSRIEAAFKKAGFSHFEWIQIEDLPKQHYDDLDSDLQRILRMFVQFKPIACFHAVKG